MKEYDGNKPFITIIDNEEFRVLYKGHFYGIFYVPTLGWVVHEVYLFHETEIIAILPNRCSVVRFLKDIVR